jgi:hypothetical protein
MAVLRSLARRAATTVRSATRGGDHGGHGEHHTPFASEVSLAFASLTQRQHLGGQTSYFPVGRPGAVLGGLFVVVGLGIGIPLVAVTLQQ